MTTLSTRSVVASNASDSKRSSPQQAGSMQPAAFKFSVVAVSICIVWLAVARHTRQNAFDLLWHLPFGRPLIMCGAFYGALTSLWSAWRLVLALRYRPTPSVSGNELPHITVVMPVFNEERLITRSLRALSGSDYPASRIQIIVVDDGSTDGTWEKIQAEADRTCGTIHAIRLRTNQGKRHALWEGFRRADGEIIVTVDSDSVVSSSALRALVSPFLRNNRVGAVAGNVRVLNRSDGLIPRMLDVRYVMTFDYKRAAQSVMGGGSVLCVAGALAAYRRSAVLPVLDAWLHQRHLGRSAHAGEDHAMTNFILKQGYIVRFQRTACVRTQAPTTYAGVARMFLRWGRSNVRETAHLASYIFTPFRAGPRASIRFNFLVGATGLLLPYIFLVAALALSVTWPAVFGLKLLAACVTGGLFPLIFFWIRERDSGAVFALAYSFYVTMLLWWVWPYALLTSHKSVWMTRGSTTK